MFLRKVISALGLLFAGIVLLAIFTFVKTAAAGGDAWIDTVPQVQKLVDLGAGKRPPQHNLDCSPGLYQPPGLQFDSVPICTNTTPLGKLTGSTLYLSSDEEVPLKGPNLNEIFLPTSGRALLLQRPSAYNGFTMGIYRHPSVGQLQKVVAYPETYYRYKAEPDQLLIDPTTGEPMRFNPNALSFSANGLWIVLDSPGRGLARVNMETFDVMLFGESLESYDFYGLSNAQLAISDDGSVVASSLIDGNGGYQDASLNMYDLDDCKPAPESYRAGLQLCVHRDIWRASEANAGISSIINSTNAPVRLRFLNDDSLSFDTTYDQTADKVFKTARFIAGVNGVPVHKMGLLGMGDSYISGEGEFDYRLGTDTDNNHCHQSEQSYPFILGRNFTTHSSISCSGAIIDDIVMNDKSYRGQVKDKVAQKDRTNRSQILSQYLPGYLNQLQFVQTYTPEAVLLSIGGNNIGFSDIIKTCVANTSGGTCYDTYEDRLELMRLIDNQFYDLRNTYLAIKNASPGVRVYVVGYPQIVKAGGDCGMNVHLNAAETKFANQLIDYIDQTAQQAARSAGVAYVDTRHSFDGHRLCEAPAGQSAVNGLTAGTDGGPKVFGKELKVIGSESYHPTKLGHTLLAATINGATHGLSLPMPNENPDIRPVIPDAASPLLADLPQSGRSQNRIMYDQDLSRDVLSSDQAQPIQYEPDTPELAPLSKYTVELHSNPVQLSSGLTDEDGQLHLAISIPANVPAGFHTLHVYGTDLAGQTVDVQKRVYVVTDPAQLSSCGIIPPTNQDADADGIDDACDGDIVQKTLPDVVDTQINDSNHSTTELSLQIVETESPIRLSGTIGATSAADIQGYTRTGQVLGMATVLSASPNAKVIIASDVQPIHPPHSRVSRHQIIWLGILIVVAAAMFDPVRLMLKAIK